MTDKPFREQERFAGLPSHVYSFVAALEQQLVREQNYSVRLEDDLRTNHKRVERLDIFVEQIRSYDGVRIGERPSETAWIIERMFEALAEKEA